MKTRLDKTYKSGLMMTNPGYFYVVRWKQVCGWIGWKPYRMRVCIHVPVVRFAPPTFAYNSGVAGVSLVEIGPFFSSILFPADDAHLGEDGYKLHSSYLKEGLRARCWW